MRSRHHIHDPGRKQVVTDHSTDTSRSDVDVDVVYFMTHYPRTALTFIALEVAEIERAGGTVRPIAINPPDAGDLGSPEAQRAHRSTSYLKRQSVATLGASFVKMFIRHPMEMSKLVVLAVTSSRLDLPLAARRLVHLVYACWSWNLVKSTGVRHFHAHFGQTPATVAWFTARIGSFDGPEPCTWSFTIHGFQDFADERVTRLDLKVRDASFVVCISDFTRAQLCRATDPSTWQRFHVVRCGIDLARFPPRPERPTAATRPRIVTVARLSPEKGHFVLLDAVSDLRDRGIDVELRIIGDGPSAGALLEAIDRLGLHGAVKLVGELQPDHVTDELRSADVFCLPSFAEGIPVSIMEAMAVGVPVVTTYVGGIPELAVDGKTALVVPPSSTPELARAIGRLIDEPELGLRLARSARSAVADHHDASRNVVALSRLMTDLPTATRSHRYRGPS
jgi:colanic acid/amylovoran biosynthesis glycosyltransferase